MTYQTMQRIAFLGKLSSVFINMQKGIFIKWLFVEEIQDFYDVSNEMKNEKRNKTIGDQNFSLYNKNYFAIKQEWIIIISLSNIGI